MTYNFKKVDINLYDVYTAVRPILDSAIMNEEFKFLVVEQLYNEKYKLNEFTAGKHTIKSFNEESIEKNHFWSNYITNDDTVDNGDSFKLQLPFTFIPKDFDLKINTDGFGFNAEVETFVYVNSLGWSSQLRIHLTGKDNTVFSSGQLQKFISSLRNKDTNDLPFILNGEKHKRFEVFKKLGELIAGDIYAADKKAGNQFSVAYKYIICPKDCSEPAKYYNSKVAKKNADISETKMDIILSDKDRMELLSILYGEEIDSGNYLKYENGTLLTWFRGKDFSLTDFDLGTLLFMQDSFSDEDESESKMFCLSSNMNSCTTMNLMLLNFHRRGTKLSSEDKKFIEFLDRTKYLLNHIPQAYKNRYCISYYTNHGSLKEDYYSVIL